MNPYRIFQILPSNVQCSNFVVVARKVVGDVWTHVGGCEGSPDHPECGEGTQAQSRECTDGTNDKCTPEDKERVVSCAVAGTALPKCGNFSYTLFCTSIFSCMRKLIK